MESGIWGFIGVVVGAASSIGTAAWIARNASKAKTREFQKDNLMQLQDSISKHTVIAIKHRTASKRDKLLADVATKEFVISSQSVTILIDRIADESLRTTLKRDQIALYSILSDTTKDKDDDEKVGIILKRSYNALEKLGVVLRSLY